MSHETASPAPTGCRSRRLFLRDLTRAGHQPSLAEPYISTGSLYLCTLAFHPLGLPASTSFWRDPVVDWTQRRIWSGQNHPVDHALAEK